MVDVAKYEKMLKARLAELGHRLEEVEQELDQPMDPGFADRATDREGDEVLESLGHAGEEEIRAINAALKRIEVGEFGDCVKCGEEILTGRLDLVPHAALCRNCAGAGAR